MKYTYMHDGIQCAELDPIDYACRPHDAYIHHTSNFYLNITAFLVSVFCNDGNFINKCYDVMENRHCFRISTSKSESRKSWQDANNICRINGSTLARITEESILSIVERFIIDADLPGDDFWIGGSRCDLWDWYWLTGTKMADSQSFIYFIINSFKS